MEQGGRAPGAEFEGSGRWGEGLGELLRVVVFFLSVWRGEDDSKAQPDVARPARGLATIRGGPAGRAGGGTRHEAGPGEGREPPGPAVRGQQRAALGLREKLPTVGSWGGCGAGNLGKPGLQDGGAGWGSAGRRRRGRSGRKWEIPGLTEPRLLDWLGRPDPSGREARAGEATKAS